MANHFGSAQAGCYPVTLIHIDKPLFSQNRHMTKMRNFYKNDFKKTIYLHDLYKFIFFCSFFDQFAETCVKHGPYDL